MKPIGRVLGALCILVLACAASGSWAALSASVDRNRVALGDTLALTIMATENEDLSNLELGPLTADFEILGRSNNSRTSYINGQVSRSQELRLEITPRREGILTVPGLRLGRQLTSALTVVVGPPPKEGAEDQNLVLEAELDRSEVYVQGQLILTLRLQQAINLEDRNITQLQLDNAFIRPLEQSSFQRTVNGRTWLVHEVRYAIFPEQSGTLVIPAQTFTARESTARRNLFDLGSSGRRIRRSTEPLTIEVLPRPDSYPNAEWLPAAALTVEESWSTPPEELRVGESATRTITLRGEGLQGAQLSPMLFPPAQGLKYYPDQPSISDSESPTGLVGTRVDSVAVVPTTAGTWQVPEVRIPWWDTRTNELRYAVLPARTLEVAAANPADTFAAPTPAPQPTVALAPGNTASIPLVGNDTSGLWQTIGVVNGIGWLLTVLYLLWTRRKPAQKGPAKTDDPQEKQAFKELLSACAAGNASQARQSLIRWSAALKSQPGMASLAQAAAAHNDAAMSAAVESLNAALYGSAPSSWDGSALATAVKQLRSAHHAGSGGENQPLQLYPQLG